MPDDKAEAQVEKHGLATTSPGQDDTLRGYRSPAKHEMPASSAGDSAMKAFAGSGDLSIVGHDKPGSSARALGTEESSAIKQFEQEKKIVDFTKNDDRSYSLTGADGFRRTVEPKILNSIPQDVLRHQKTFDNKTEDVKLDPDSQEAKDARRQVAEMKFKQTAEDRLKSTPLNDEQQKASDQMIAALRLRSSSQEKSLEAVKNIAQQFSNDPKGFESVFAHVSALATLNNMKGVDLSLGSSGTGSSFTVRLYGGEPARVKLGDQSK